jgi:hypothetical protein
VAVGSGVAVCVGSTVAVSLGFGVAIAVGVGVGVDTAAAWNGPPMTVTAFVCALPATFSPRTDVAPSGTHFGTFTLMFALPVLLVVTWLIWV